MEEQIDLGQNHVKQGSHIFRAVPANKGLSIRGFLISYNRALDHADVYLQP